MMREYAMEVQSKAAAMQSTFHNIHEVRGSVLATATAPTSQASRGFTSPY